SHTLTPDPVSPARATVGLNGTQQFRASAKDQFGPSMIAVFNWPVSGGGTINGSGLFTAGSAAGGPFTVTASSGAVSGTASVTVVNAAPTVASPPSASPNPAGGTATNLTVLGADHGGEPTLTYTRSAPAPAPVP